MCLEQYNQRLKICMNLEIGEKNNAHMEFDTNFNNTIKLAAHKALKNNKKFNGCRSKRKADQPSHQMRLSHAAKEVVVGLLKTSMNAVILMKNIEIHRGDWESYKNLWKSCYNSCSRSCRQNCQPCHGSGQHCLERS